MKNLIAISLLTFIGFDVDATPLVQEPVRVEIWSRGLSARLELNARGQHFEMTARMNGGQSTWKQVHRKDVTAILDKLMTLETLVAQDEGVHQIKSAGCRQGWVRMRPQRPSEWRTCLDRLDGPALASEPARRAVALATEVAEGFEKLVKAPEAPIVLRQAKVEEPVPLIHFAQNEEERLMRIEAEVQDAERFANEQMARERLRQELISREIMRDPFKKVGKSKSMALNRVPVKIEVPGYESDVVADELAPKRAPASDMKLKLKPEMKDKKNAKAKPVREIANVKNDKEVTREFKRLQSLVKSVEKYVAETPVIPKSVKKLAPSKKDLLEAGKDRASQTAGPRAP